VRAALGVVLIGAAVVAAGAGAGRAAAPSVGALPPGPKATIVTEVDELVAVALPHRTGGRVWRIARAVDGAVLHQVSEADVGANVVLVFATAHAGKATLAFALTRGERTKALESRLYQVTVR
jgi:hypothetical protein